MDEPADAASEGGHPAAAPGQLRVALVTETYPPEVNGVALTVARIVDGLRARGHQVGVVRPRQPGMAVADAATLQEPTVGARDPHAPGCADLLVPGMPIPRYPHLRMGLPCRRVLQRLWAQQRPDVVHIATEGPLGWSALCAARALRLPVTSDFRTNFHAYSAHYGIGWLQAPVMAYLRHFHNRTGGTMVPTVALHRQLQAAGFRDVAVVARGVDTQQFSPLRRSAALRASWGAAPGDLVMACVGRLAPEKNLFTLLEAFAAVQQATPHARLVLVGDGPLRAALQLRCPGAVFAGQRIGNDLAAHYASADLFAFPSLTETFGNVTPEALASGLPVLAFDHAAAAQLVQSGRNGVLVPFGDGAAFVRAATALAAAPVWRAAMRDAARQSTACLGWDAVVGRFEAVLAAVVRQAPGRAGQALVPAPVQPG